jgi:hypothetical protein
MFMRNTNKTEILKTIGIVLLNIPITIIYFYILIEFIWNLNWTQHTPY